MKNLLIILGLCSAFSASAQVLAPLNTRLTSSQITDSLKKKVTFVDLTADLKALPVFAGALAMTAGNLNLSDGLGGFYRFSDTSTLASDTVNLNSIVSSNSATGRWLRLFKRNDNVGGGMLENNGITKRFYITGTTDSNGEVTFNLTTDNTTNGTAIFRTINFIDTWIPVGSASVSGAIQSYMKSISANLKQVTYGFYKANALTLTLGLLYNPFASIGTGQVVKCRIDGF